MERMWGQVGWKGGDGREERVRGEKNMEWGGEGKWGGEYGVRRTRG